MNITTNTEAESIFSDSLEKIAEGIQEAQRIKNTDFLGAITRLENLLTRITKGEYDKHSELYKLNYTKILTHLANIHYFSSKYQKALHYTKLLEEASDFYSDKRLRGNAYLQLGNINSDLAAFPEAMKYSMQALEIFKEIDDKEGIGSTNNNIGNVFLFQKNFESALPYYKVALEVFTEINQVNNKSNVLQNLASIHIHSKEYKQALECLTEAENLKKELNDSFGVAVCRFLMGDVNSDAGKFNEAVKNYNEALEIQHRLDDKNGILYSNMHIGKAYLDKYTTEGKKDKSVLAKAEKFLLESLFTAQRINSKYTLSLIYSNLASYYELREDFEKSLEYQKKLYAAEKEIFNEKVSEEVMKLEKELQVKEAKHTAEINQLRNVELAETIKKLEEIVKQKNEFFGVVVHDLKNPIGNIKLLAEFLIDAGNYSEKEINEFKKYIVESADTSLELITQLLDYAAIEQGKINLNVSNFNIREETERIIRLYKLKTMQKLINVHFVNGLTDSVVHSDRNAVVQIIDNLFSNAIKFSEEGKKIYVRLSEGKGFFQIEIEDEGPGFSEKDKEKLFSKFSKLSARPTGGEHSSGLGLSIVKKLIDSLHGRIECISEKGKGANMIVQIPA